MKRNTVLAVALLLAVLGAAGAAAQTTQTKVAAEPGKAEVASLVEATATITAIDAATRTITLKGEKGEVRDVVAGDEVKNFASLKVGDTVHFQYYESLSLQLDKVTGGEATATESKAEMRAEPGELPGGIKTRTVTLTAKVTAVDAAASTVTLVGPKGRSETIEVDAEDLAKVKVGDLVKAVYTEALAISVSRVEVK